MAGIDDLRRLNPPGRRQVRSVLDRLLEVGATTPELIGEVSSSLESYGVPYLACSAQIGVNLPVDEGEYDVPGATIGSMVRLSIRPIYVSVDGLGRCAVGLCEPSDPVAVATATQIVGYLWLTDRKASYYRNYVAAITPDGPPAIESHINPDNAPAHVGQKRTPSMWEGEIVSHACGHFRRSIATFLQHYRMLARRDIPVPQPLFGLFTLLLPGRVVTGDPPVPLAAAYVIGDPNGRRRTVSGARLRRSIKLRIPVVDDYTARLLSHARLFESGEVELGWIGAVSVIEEYLSRFIDWPKPQRRPSIGQSLGRHPLSTLPSALLDRLRATAQLRNDIVHRNPLPANSELAFDIVADVGLAAYREIRNNRFPPHP